MDQPNVECTTEQDPIEDDNFDDEFGDFEEASGASEFQQTETTTSPPQDQPSESNFHFTPGSSRKPSVEDSQYGLEIEGLPSIVDSDLWSHLSDSQGRTSFEESVLISDLFSYFDTVDEVPDGDTELGEFERRALGLWLKLRYVEEALALKYKWPASSSYLNLLKALHFISLLKTESQLNGSDTSSKHSSLENAENPNKNSDDMVVDSLLVPPVEFDWQSSGLSNPLTGSSISANSAMLECNFASLGDTTTSSSQLNGQSILERDLDAFGLSGPVSSYSSAAKNAKSSENLPLNLDGLLFAANANNHSAQKQKVSPAARKYKDPRELSLDARKLFDRLPDLSYMMLSDRLQFPITEDQRQQKS